MARFTHAACRRGERGAKGFRRSAGVRDSFEKVHDAGGTSSQRVYRTWDLNAEARR